MVVGLGRYVARMYGSDIAKQCFTQQHWRATKGWRYRSKTGSFDRPDTKNLLTTMAFDNNLSSICRLQQLSLSTKPQELTSADPTPTPAHQRPTTNQSTTESADRYNDVAGLLQDTGSTGTSDSSSSGLSGLTEAVLQKENDMMVKIREQRNQAHKLTFREAKVHHINISEDQSVVSRLTEQSQGSSDEESLSSHESINSHSTSGSKGKIRFNVTILDKIIKPNMSYTEALSTAEAYFSHKVNREKSTKDMILHNYLDQKFPEHRQREKQGGDRDNPDIEEEDMSQIDKQLSVVVAENNHPPDEQQDESDNSNQQEMPASSQNTGKEP